jgi:hypothetical protein
MSNRLAFDRSVRVYDVDGRLHVRVTRISKATVNPYYGHEIPGAEALGLEPGRVYRLLRDPEELAKAAPTFNNLPILSKHVPVTANDEDSHMPGLVVGSTGTDAVFRDPYLLNSAVVWSGPAIAGIESREQQEWSCAYRYTPDMTPGTYKGLHYDGIMRNIVGNHVALVEEGRAGSDVVVGDSQFEGHMALQSRTALMLSGALTALIGPKLADGVAFDATPFCRDVTRKNFKSATKDLAPRLIRAVTPKLAADEGIDVDDVIKVIGAVQGSGGLAADEPDMIPEPDISDKPPAIDDDGDVVSRICAMLEGKVDDETLAAVRAMSAAPAAQDGYDEDMDDEDEDKVKPAMDAAAIRSATLKEVADIRAAEKAVFPYVGEVMGMDSAAAVYKLALDAAKIDTKGVHPSAFPAMVKMLPRPDASEPKAPRIALDAKADAEFRSRFPTAQALKIA